MEGLMDTLNPTGHFLVYLLVTLHISLDSLSNENPFNWAIRRSLSWTTNLKPCMLDFCNINEINLTSSKNPSVVGIIPQK